MPNLEGYFEDEDYTAGYYPKLAPSSLALVLAARGLDFPQGEITYLEIGFGKGLSLIIHGAANSGAFWGNDLNASHVQFAETLNSAGAAGVRLLNVSISELANDAALPSFDFIVMHGVWSWISQDNRQHILKLASEKLKPGGVFYVSYNALPGCAPIIPLQRLLRLHYACNPRRGPAVERMSDAIEYVRTLQRAGSSYVTSATAVRSRIDEFYTHDLLYLCHEYLGLHWEPQAFSEMAEQLEGAGLSFVGSANLALFRDDHSFSEAQRAVIGSTADFRLQESARDWFSNRAFREDVFTKNPRVPYRVSSLERLSFSQVKPESDTIFLPTGCVQLADEPFSSILRALRRDGYRRKSCSEIVAEVGATIDLVADPLLLLVANGTVQAGFSSHIAKVDSCAQLNEKLLGAAREGRAFNALASPVLGAGVRLTRAEQLCIIAHRQGAKKPNDFVLFMRQAGLDDNQRSVPADRLAFRALQFIHRLPHLAALGLL